VTRESVAEKLGAYLRHDLSLAALLDWPESTLMNNDFEDKKRGQLNLSWPGFHGHLTNELRLCNPTFPDCETMVRLQFAVCARRPSPLHLKDIQHVEVRHVLSVMSPQRFP
jgi:hypothetical protein